ncbi:MAG: phenylalanine--tRNA ligase subunit beta [Candidatus Woesearchaeota archaeon]
MPTITFSLNDLSNLVGKKIKETELKELLVFAKGELEGVSGDEATVALNDTNLPYLWSVEGLAILFRGLLGKEKGIPQIKIESSDAKIFVDKALRTVRPYIAAFIAKGHKLDDHLLKQMIQLQEKFCEQYGRKRQKVAIGIYPCKKITFPVSYVAVQPRSASFIPLDFDKEMDLLQILEQHPKGKDYAWILKDHKRYPLLVDARKEVLSFPPIINSNTTGKLEIGDDEIFFEATGTDQKAINLAANIFAHAFALRGFKIYSVKILYSRKQEVTPDIKTETIKIEPADIKNLLGLELCDSEIKRLLERARYDFVNYKVTIPCIRQDIMHPVDVIEDIGIIYGYDKISSLPLTTFTQGRTFPIRIFIDKIRELMVGLGYQEIASPMLVNKELLYQKMNTNDFGTIEIENFMSMNYSVVRSWLLPCLMDVLMHNKHADYPQRIFEQGLVTVKKDDKAIDYEMLSVLTCHADANYTEVKQALDYLLRMLGVQYEIEDAEHGSFIPGRVARITVNKRKVAFIGEIHPAVLNNFGVEMPVAAFELNLTELFEATKQ